MLNQRRAAIVRRLLTESCPGPTVAALAAEHGVSERLIRYDLEAIAEWLQNHGGQLRNDSQGGFCLAGDTDRIGAALKELGAAKPGPADYALSPEERRLRIVRSLLTAPGFETVPALARRLQVSRGTVYTDLEAVEAWLRGFGLTLEKRPNAGVRILGAELGWRRAACAFLAEQVGAEHLTRWVLEGGLSHQEHPDQPEVVTPREVQHAVASIRRSEEALSLRLSDASFTDLALYLAVMIHRRRAGKTMTAAPTGSPADQDQARTREWEIAESLLADVRAACDLPQVPAERAALAQHLQQAGTRLEGHGPTAAAGEAELRLATTFVRQVGSLIGVDLQQDPDLIPGLALHLRPVPFRLRQFPPLQNPMLPQIQAMFPDMYRAARQAGASLEKEWRQPVPDAEIGFLTMHLGAALERIKTRPVPRPRALVVCGSGIGTARLLASRLQAALPEIELAGITSVLGMQSLLASDTYDLVIATCRVARAPVPVVQVSPLLLAQDLRTIRQALEPGSFKDPTTERGRQPMLTEILTPTTIRLDVPADDWEAAVRAAGQVLSDAGITDPAYGEAMVASVRQIGPYIVIAPGIAMPHARPTDGVHRLGIALVRLSRPVRFGHETNDPVDLVFALAAVDPETHLKALTQLSGLLSSETGVERLRAATDIPTVMAVLAEAVE